MNRNLVINILLIIAGILLALALFAAGALWKGRRVADKACPSNLCSGRSVRLFLGTGPGTPIGHTSAPAARHPQVPATLAHVEHDLVPPKLIGAGAMCLMGSNSATTGSHSHCTDTNTLLL